MTAIHANTFALIKNPRYYQDIKTFQGFLKSDYSFGCNRNIFEFCESLFNRTKWNNISNEFKILSPRWISHPVTFKDVYSKDNLALWMPDQDVKALLMNIPKYQKRLYALDKTILTIPLFYKMLNDLKSFKDQLNVIINAFYESGIAQWKDHMEEWRLLNIYNNNIETLPRIKLSFYDLHICFLIWIGGLGIAFLVFIYEMVSFYIFKYKNIEPIMFVN